MKRYASIVIVLGVLAIGGMVLTRPSVTEYVAPEVQIQVEEVQVDALEKAIKDAQDAKQTEIKATAQSAYDEAYTHEMKTVELEIRKEYQGQNDSVITVLEKETKTY